MMPSSKQLLKLSLLLALYVKNIDAAWNPFSKTISDTTLSAVDDASPWFGKVASDATGSIPVERGADSIKRFQFGTMAKTIADRLSPKLKEFKQAFSRGISRLQEGVKQYVEDFNKKTMLVDGRVEKVDANTWAKGRIEVPNLRAQANRLGEVLAAGMKEITDAIKRLPPKNRKPPTAPEKPQLRRSATI